MIFKQETQLICPMAADLRKKASSPRPQVCNSYVPSIQRVGGVFLLSNGRAGDHGVLWQIDNGSTGSLLLQHFTVPWSADGLPINLQFDAQLFPKLALLEVSTSSGTSNMAAGLLSCGIAFFGRLDAVTEDMHLQYYDISNLIHAHGAPTSLGSLASALIVGCSDGTVLVVPYCLTLGDTVSQPVELRGSGWGLTRLFSEVFQRTQHSPVAACLSIKTESAPVALIVYDDCAMRAFSSDRYQEILSDHLLPRPSNGSSRSQGHQDRLLVTSAVACSTPSSSSQGTEIIVMATFETCNTGSRQAMVFFLKTVPGGRLTIHSSLALTGCDNINAFLSAEGDQDTIWALAQGFSVTQVLGFSKQDGSVVKKAFLREQQVEVSCTDATQKNAVMKELWEDVLSSFPGDGFSAEAQILAHLQTPGQLCRMSLLDAITSHGVQLSVHEAMSAPLSQLRTSIRGAVQTVQRRNPGLSLNQAHMAFLTSYHESWERRHGLLALFMHEASGALGCVRSGGILGALRSCAPVEELYITGAGAAMQLSVCGTVLVQCAGAAAGSTGFAAVHACSRAVAEMLGPQSLDAFVGLMAAGFRPVEELLPIYVTLCLSGPSGGSSSRSHSDDITRQQHSRWRQQRQTLLLKLGQKLGGGEDPVGMLISYCEYVQLEGTAAQLRHTAVEDNTYGSHLPAPYTDYLAASSHQLAYQQCCVLRDVLLLCGLVGRLCAVGTVPLDAKQLHHLESVAIPQLGSRLQRAAISYWLASTPAALESSPGSGTEQDLVDLARQLSLAAPSAAGKASSNVQIPRWKDTTLAAKLMSDALPTLDLRLQSSTDQSRGVLQQAQLDQASRELVLWLQDSELVRGGHAQERSAASLPSSPSRVVALGCSLFSQREFAALRPLSRLACVPAVRGSVGGAEDFLRGLSCMCELGNMNSSKKAERRALVEEASGCFFRAAASLATGCPGTLSYTISTLKQLATGLPSSNASAQPTEGPSSSAHSHSLPEDPHQLQLSFYEVVMLLFEREGAPEGAILFARAALQLLHLAASSQPQHDIEAPDKLAMEGRLWSQVFTYCCELGAYEDAYTAVISNPVHERLLDSLRRLIHELCTQSGDRLVTLNVLPYAGIVTILPETAVERGEAGAMTEDVGGSTKPDLKITVPLLQEVLNALRRRALNSDLSTQPQPYDVLYDFLVYRSDLRGAAGAMLALARRLRLEGTVANRDAAEESLHAYEAAINVLSLVEESERWIDLTDPWLQLHAVPQSDGIAYAPSTVSARKTGLLFRAIHDDSINGSGVDDRFTAFEDTPVDRVGNIDDRVQEGSAGGRGMKVREGRDSQVVEGKEAFTLEKLEKEYLLLRCAIEVAGQLPGMDPLKHWKGEDEIFSQLLQAGKVESALALAHACWCHGALTEAVERALSSLATQCARSQVQEEGHTSSLQVGVSDWAADPAQRELLHGQSLLGSRSAPQWKLLQQLLQRYESGNAEGVEVISATRGSLKVAVAHAILKEDRRLSLPEWLLRLFMGVDKISSQASLLEVYLQYDCLATAVSLIESMLSAWSRTDPRQRAGRYGAVWIPHQLIGELRERLLIESDRTGSESILGILDKLDSCLTAHLSLVAHDSMLDPAEVSPMSVGSGAGGRGHTSWRASTQPGAGGTSGGGVRSSEGWRQSEAVNDARVVLSYGGTPSNGFGFGEQSPYFGFGASGIDALPPPSPSLMWLPPPISSLGT
ncbi:hypothetical protein CEUSTIGMA_g2923.t1 [Chlamydomonas eustigma]|uniref:Uncharacterized protein n=1 Tax=Chlamydomonas eustigma TaxID=1157962 RepID=A0A250WY90_9CHLO|nr:hypothetical protein CEUSTIGMA_g2923.t1 [Chlamydomonas eustigma]|eukprot:GAX75480.1 hypothetical protein CEUSTIGMA_g2923.t1 [Chlamydomonas eustigma]